LELPYHLRVDAVELHPDLGQIAPYSRDLIRMQLPALVQPALNDLAGLYLVRKELLPGLLVESDAAQSAVYRFEHLLFAGWVIDRQTACILDGRDLAAEGEALDDQVCDDVK
jgi:hypothetical protein